MVALSVAVTFVCLRALNLRVLLHALGICAHGKVMLTQVLITFPLQIQDVSERFRSDRSAVETMIAASSSSSLSCF